MCTCVRVCKGGVVSSALALPYFLLSTSVAGGGRGTYLWAFHATVIPSNLIQPSSFSLVCFSHIGACRLKKTLCACVSVGIREMGEEGGQTELIGSEYVCMHKYLCCVLSSTKWLQRCAPWEVVCLTSNWGRKKAKRCYVLR